MASSRRSRADVTPRWPPRWRLEDVVYDAETHTSRLPDGRDVPHVTDVLGAVGVSTDFGAVAARGPRMARAVELAGARGHAVHADCHAYDDDDLDIAQCDPRVAPYVEAWARCRRDKGLVPLQHGRERRVFHPFHIYTGFVDGLFREYPGQRVVLADIKTGDPESSAAHLQTAAYEEALLRERYLGVPLPDGMSFPLPRWAVWLQPGRRVPYVIVDYTDVRARPDHYEDFPKFLACLTVYREQPGRRKRTA